MSTNAIIIVEGLDNISVWKHWDGYPDAILGWLTAFNEDFSNNRGDDPSYKLAQLLRSSVRDAETYDLDPSVFTGWGVIATDEWDTDYKYTLHTDGKVTYKTR